MNLCKACAYYYEDQFDPYCEHSAHAGVLASDAPPVCCGYNFEPRPQPEHLTAEVSYTTKLRWIADMIDADIPIQRRDGVEGDHWLDGCPPIPGLEYFELRTKSEARTGTFQTNSGESIQVVELTTEVREALDQTGVRYGDTLE